MDRNVMKQMLDEKVKNVEQIVYQFLPEATGWQRTVQEAMNYSVQAGGKRLRPLLIKEVYELFGGTGREIEPFMAALEMIHTYSLVHDDLPAMDNDEYRRGRKTTWVVYGEAMAILAGDGLLNFAFETAVKAFDYVKPEEMPKVAEALAVLGRKAGIYGMIGGQTADIEAEDRQEPLTSEQLLFIHEHKTAALIQAAMMIGGILGGADRNEIKLLEKCAYNIGIAFQIQDDVLDVIGDSQELGKQVGSDEQNHKQTYVTIYGLEKSTEDVEKLSKEAVEILQSFSRRNEFLEALILDLIHRRK
ncbi:MAG: polyprenyl synthetase family protein [Lachnospiraceae bacterium]|nr:polyprenyl synthetase family protein [Lachnospiraceae bacterium]